MTGRVIGTLTCAGLLSLTIGVGRASAQSGDHTFASQAALANMAEIQLGHLAVKKAQNADVKKFAQMMIEDHVKAQQDLADAARGAGIPWPKQLDDKHKQLQQKLSGLSDERFDREYMKAMVDGHRTVEAMLTARINEGDASGSRTSAGAKSDDAALTAKVNQWAAKTLPSVRAHLKEAEQVSGDLEKGERSSRR